MKLLIVLILTMLPLRANAISIDFSGTWDHLCRQTGGPQSCVSQTQSGLLKIGDSFSGEFSYDDGGIGWRPLLSASWSTVPDDSINLTTTSQIFVTASQAYVDVDGFRGAYIIARMPGIPNPYCSETGMGYFTEYKLSIGTESIRAACVQQSQVYWSVASASNIYIGDESRELLSIVETPEPQRGVVFLGLLAVLVMFKRRTRI